MYICFKYNKYISKFSFDRSIIKQQTKFLLTLLFIWSWPKHVYYVKYKDFFAILKNEFINNSYNEARRVKVTVDMHKESSMMKSNKKSLVFRYYW